jgi:hypothetical protein
VRDMSPGFEIYAPHGTEGRGICLIPSLHASCTLEVDNSNHALLSFTSLNKM